MADTLKEDRDGQYSVFVQGGNAQYIDENGFISQAMIKDIREAKYE
jgi:hypothetical protein